MALPYAWRRSLVDTRAMPINMELEVSLNIADGMPLKWSSNGKLTPIVNSSDRPLFFVNGMAVTSSVGSLVNLSGAGTTSFILNQIGNGYNATAGPGGNQSVQQLGGYADCIPAQNGSGIWRTTFTPIFKGVVANTSGSPYSIILPNSPQTFAANALQGGTVYCASLNQQAQITASSSVTSGNPITLTIAAPLGQPGATINADGLTFSACPFGRGMSGLQFSHVVSVASDGYVPSQTGGVGQSDYSGGYIQIWEVDLQNMYVDCIFN